MDKETKQKLAKEFFDNMDLTKEQYLSLCGLVDDLELEKLVKEETIDDILNSL